MALYPSSSLYPGTTLYPDGSGAPAAQTVSPTAIVSGETFGSPTVTVGPVTLTLAGITSAETFGAPTVTLPGGAQSVTLTAIGPGEAFGVATVTVVFPPEDPAPDTTPTTGGLGLGLLPRPGDPGFFRIKLTSLHHPGDTPIPAATLARLEDFTDASVTIPINDQREATVTISMDDPAATVVEPYKTLLHVTYVTPIASYLVFWGIVTQPVWDSSQETLTIPAVDMALKLQNRQVRFGTRILNGSDNADEPNPFNGTGDKRSTGHVPVDYVGIGWLRDAARNNGPQNARGVPPLGITDGINTASPLELDTPYKIEARRGDILWDVLQQIISYQVSPDFELEPRDGTFGVYARLNTYARQGHTDPTRIIFHDGFGNDNCQVTYQPGGKIINASHQLSTGDQARVTTSDEDSQNTYGIYTEWSSTDYPATDTSALADLGQQQIDAYGEPPDYFQVAPNMDAGLYYLDHYAVGDACTAAVRRGQLKRQVTGDITSVKLTQSDSAGNVQPDLEVAVSVSRTTTTGGDV